MTKADLITGFLGSGKTTFLLKYAKYLMDSGQKIGIIVNDLGAINVDMLLLQDLEKSGAVTEMVIGGDPDCRRRRLKTKLIALGMQKLDRVLIEPSGVFDADEFFDMLYEEPFSRWYEIGSVIAIVDAALEEDLSKEADYLLISQLADAGCTILSRTQIATAEQIEGTIRHINRAMERNGCSLRLQEDMVLAKDWKDLTKEDFKRIMDCGSRPADYVKRSFGGENGFQSLFFMNLTLGEEEMKAAVRDLLHDESFGHVYRVKGFLPREDGWLEINATRDRISTARLKEGQNVVILIGERLDRGKIEGRMRQSAD